VSSTPADRFAASATLVLASEGKNKIYLKAKDAATVLGIKESNTTSTITRTVAAPALSGSVDEQNVTGIWEITLGGDLNLNEIEVLAKKDAANLKAEAKMGLVKDEETAGIELGGITISEGCNVEVTLIQDETSVTDNGTVRVTSVDTTTDPTAISVKVTGDKAVTQPVDSTGTPINIGSFRVKLTLGEATWTIMVPFSLVKSK